MAIGSDGELDRLCFEISEYSLELGMHTVLTGAEIHRAHGKAVHDGLHLIERETVRASRIAIAKRAGQIALVGEAEPERNTGVRCNHASSGRRRLRCEVVHLP